MRSFLSDTYSKARHDLGRFDDFAGGAKAVYRSSTPLVAIGMDLYGASDETTMKAFAVKQALDVTGKGVQQNKENCTSCRSCYVINGSRCSSNSSNCS